MAILSHTNSLSIPAAAVLLFLIPKNMFVLAICVHADLWFHREKIRPLFVHCCHGESYYQGSITVSFFIVMVHARNSEWTNSNQFFGTGNFKTESESTQSLGLVSEFIEPLCKWAPGHFV